MIILDPTQSPLDCVPPPDLIRNRLARLFAEARLLRSLLRVSESKSRSPHASSPAEDLDEAGQREVSLVK